MGMGKKGRNLTTDSKKYNGKLTESVEWYRIEFCNTKVQWKTETCQKVNI